MEPRNEFNHEREMGETYAADDVAERPLKTTNTMPVYKVSLLLKNVVIWLAVTHVRNF